MAATTYVIAASRAGHSAVVQETTAKTYIAASPVVLTENGTASGGTATAQPHVWVLA